MSFKMKNKACTTTYIILFYLRNVKRRDKNPLCILFAEFDRLYKAKYENLYKINIYKRRKICYNKNEEENRQMRQAERVGESNAE